MADDERVPVDQVLVGMALHALPEGWTPVEALVFIKSLDATGQSEWSYRTSATPNLEELLGVLTVQRELVKHRLLSQWLGDESEDQ